MALSERSRNSIFGPPGKVPKSTVQTPWGIKTVCHDLIVVVFHAACAEAAAVKWTPRRIDSYNPRPIRGTEDRPKPVWSMHAYALAWDFFATGPNVPPPGGVWTPENPVTAEFAACFTRRGFRWGKEFDRVDEPHIEWPGGKPTAAQERPWHPDAVAQPTEEDDMGTIYKLKGVPYDEWWLVASDAFWRRTVTKQQRDELLYAKHAKDGGEATVGFLAHIPEAPGSRVP